MRCDAAPSNLQREPDWLLSVDDAEHFERVVADGGDVFVFVRIGEVRAGRITNRIHVDAADVVGLIVGAEFFDGAARRLSDPDGMIGVFLFDNAIGVQQRFDGFATPLRLVGAFPNAEGGIAAEFADELPQPIRFGRMGVADR